MKLISNTSDRLREALNIRNMKQSELVEKTKIGKSSISTYLNGEYKPKQDKIMILAQALNVNETWLMGYDVTMERNEKSYNTTLTQKDEKDIAKKMDSLIEQIDTQDALMFDGEPLDEESKELLKASLENSLRMAKAIAKQKYTPKKYRK